MSMTTEELAEAIEALMDDNDADIIEATDALCYVALGKAEHLGTVWNDTQAARVMMRRANMLEHAAYNMRGIR